MAVPPGDHSGDPYRAPPPRIEPPPRRLPLGLWLHLLFGGRLNQVGWAVLAFSLIFVHVFVVDSELFSAMRFLGTLEQSPGTVIRSDETSAAENDERIIAVQFRFVDRRGVERTGVSYVNSRAPDPGTNVTVEYPEANSKYARIVGMRSRTFEFEAGGLIVLVFPLVALWMIVGGGRSGWRACALLRRGRVGWGRLVSRQGTGTSIDEQPVIALTFEFVTGEGQRCQAVARTHEPGPLLDDEWEQLVYDPRDPRRSSMIDHLPGAPRIDAEGRLHEPSLLAALARLFFPCVVLFQLIFMVYCEMRSIR